MALWLTTAVELRVALVLGALIAVFSYHYQWFSSVPPFTSHLGAEYYNIAVALVHGRGYGNPFGRSTGPTAWMPPLFPFLLAGLLLGFRKKILVAKVVVALTALALTAVGVILFSIAKEQSTRVRPLVIVGLFAGWLWAFYAWFFGITHDIWLLTLIVGLIALAFFRYVKSGRLNSWTWGLLGGLTAAASPSITFAWLCLTLSSAWRDRAQRRALLVACGIALGMATPWTVRNAYVFHQIIPTKSNLFYEAYQANYLDDDGIYDGTFENHPYNSRAARSDYADSGERQFIAQHKQKFFAALEDDPGRYMYAVLHRLAAVTIDYVPSKTEHASRAQSSMQRIAYALPCLGLLGLLASRRKRDPFLLGMAIFYVAYLVPYVFVAFYLRYMMPLTPVLMLFLFGAIDQLALAWRPLLARTPGEATPGPSGLDSIRAHEASRSQNG